MAAGCAHGPPGHLMRKHGDTVLLEVADQRLTVDVISPLHVLTRIGLLGPARREHDIAARSRLGCGCA